jgi:uncharacterized integral membrane protein
MGVVRWVVGAALFLALLFLSLQNSDVVTLKFYHWWSWQAPLIFIVFSAFALGVAVGLLTGAVRTARLKRQLSRLRREHRRAAPIGDMTRATAPGAVVPPGAGLESRQRPIDG